MRRTLPLLVLAAALAGCGGGKPAATTTPAPKQPVAPKAVWLCFPGRLPDPCSATLTTTLVGPGGRRTVAHLREAAKPPIDCFYVYPTVSDENRGNADRSIGLGQILVAQTQAAPFSQACRVFAPVYRQITDRGLTTPSLHASGRLAYDSVLNAWRDYLAHWNDGRGVVLIGHSQGAYILKHLVATVIAREPAQRRLLVSAILLGGQVHAPDRAGAAGGDTGGVPPCASSTATGCVIAYSSFSTEPPRTAMFGRSRIAGTHIVCVNPARPGSSATAAITPLVPTAIMRLAGLTGGTTASISTPWVAYPDLYTARCKRAGNASWLQITRIAPPGDTRPAVRPVFGAGWGLHATDVNIALTQLVDLVRGEAQSYRRRPPNP